MNTPTTTTPAQSRRLILLGAAAVAAVSTAAAYSAMVGFGTDVLAMSLATAYAFAGVFELSLVTVALMAREAAQHDRDASTLLTLTWVLSAASGTFAAWHEIYEGHPIPAAGFRLAVPLLAALMWHLALIGDRHLAARRSWSELRTGARMHALFLATEAWHRAVIAHDQAGTARTRRRLDRANARRLRARSIALRTIDPADMDREITAWLAALDAVNRGTAHIVNPQPNTPDNPDTATDSPDTAALTAALTAPTAITAPKSAPIAAPEPRVRTDTAPAAGSDARPDTGPGTGSEEEAGEASAQEAAALRAQGLTVPEVAARLGVSDRTVRRWTNPMPTTSAPSTTPRAVTA